MPYQKLSVLLSSALLSPPVVGSPIYSTFLPTRYVFCFILFISFFSDYSFYPFFVFIYNIYILFILVYNIFKF